MMNLYQFITRARSKPLHIICSLAVFGKRSRVCTMLLLFDVVVYVLADKLTRLDIMRTMSLT